MSNPEQSSFDVHICLISQQPDPNLLPLFDPRLRPQQVILVVSNGMKQRAENLKKALGNAFSVRVVDIANPYAIEESSKIVEAELLRLVEEQISDKRILVNLTGGLKTMSIGAFMAASSLEISCLYVDYSNNQAQLFKKLPRSQNEPDQYQLLDLDCSKITIGQYLAAHGKNIVENSPWKPLTDEEQLFADDVLRMVVASPKPNKKDTISQVLKTVNWLSSEDSQKGLTRAIPDYLQNSEPIQLIIDDLTRNNWATATKDKLTFKNDEVRSFINGRWYEKWVANVILNMGLNIHPLNITVSAVDSNAKNEFDVAFLYKGKLHVIEVKSSDLNELKDNQNIAHKLEAISQESGGLAAKRCLVSLQTITNKTTLMGRSKDKDIELIQGNAASSVRELTRHLKQWINS